MESNLKNADMNKINHTQEPWKIYTDPNQIAPGIEGANNKTVLFFKDKEDPSDTGLAGNSAQSISNANRIIECVNALAGIGNVQEWADDKRKQYVELLHIKMQHKKMLNALEKIKTHLENDKRHKATCDGIAKLIQEIAETQIK